MQNYIHIVKDETFTKKEMIHITIKNKKIALFGFKIKFDFFFLSKIENYARVVAFFVT